MISPMDVILSLITPDSSPSTSPTNTMERLEGGVYPALGECPEDVMSEAQRTRQAVAQLQQKILKLTEQLRIEQVARDDNVSEYLDLSAHAVDKQQSARIKQVFEKKNQKSAASISQLQRKLDHYHRRLREADHCGLPRQPKDVLRDMQQGLRGVGARLSEGVVDSVTHLATKPREIACLFRHRFGSADNISTLKEGAEGGEDGRHLQSSPKFGSEEDCSSATSGSNSVTGGPGGSPGSRGGWDVLVQEVQELREAQAQLEQTLESLKNSHLRECAVAMQTLQEERFRCERLEEQLNDLTELHQNEILNLKQELLSVEEKINYQSNERARDLQEALEACQTRVSKMELQQQVVQLECLENAAARTLLGKLISVLLALMAVLLVFVTGVANCVIPMMKTRSRSVSTLLLALLLAVLWKNWERFSGHTYRILRVS